MNELYSKADIARAKKVSERTVDRWVVQGLLPPPIKLGPRVQSRVRWTQENVATLDANLAALAAAQRKAA